MSDRRLKIQLHEDKLSRQRNTKGAELLDFWPKQKHPNPLVVDVEDTLVRSNLLIETIISFIAINPLNVFVLLALLFKGKTALKAAVAASVGIDAGHLPYDQRALSLIEKAKADGRSVYLVSSNSERYVAAIAARLGLDGWLASDGEEELRSEFKSRCLYEAFGEEFEYLRRDNIDLKVLKACHDQAAAHSSGDVRTMIASLQLNLSAAEERKRGLRPWIKLIRVHQWAKNALVFLPVLTAHELVSSAFPSALIAFFAFSLAASAVYILNDLVDVEADRKHPTKKDRPLAAGTVSAARAIIVGLALGAASLMMAGAISLTFLGVLLSYLALTTAYSFSLKRKMLIDVVTLAGLYTIRVLGGAAATSITVSVWLLGFSLFLFTSLALIKRYVELAARADANLPNPINRDYQKEDLSIIAALSAAAGFNAVTIFAMYVSSDAVTRLYSHPQVLWLACPLMTYWIGRALIMAHRRLLDEDPIVFAMKDRGSILTGILLLLIIFSAR